MQPLLQLVPVGEGTTSGLCGCGCDLTNYAWGRRVLDGSHRGCGSTRSHDLASQAAPSCFGCSCSISGGGGGLVLCGLFAHTPTPGIVGERRRLGARAAPMPCTVGLERAVRACLGTANVRLGHM